MSLARYRNGFSCKHCGVPVVPRLGASKQGPPFEGRNWVHASTIDSRTTTISCGNQPRFKDTNAEPYELQEYP